MTQAEKSRVHRDQDVASADQSAALVPNDASFLQIEAEER